MESKMHRDQPGRMLGGVCAAIARELRVDVALVRVGFVVGCAVSGGLAFGVYMLLWVLTPFGPTDVSPATRILDWLDGLINSSPSRRPTDRANP